MAGEGLDLQALLAGFLNQRLYVRSKTTGKWEPLTLDMVSGTLPINAEMSGSVGVSSLPTVTVGGMPALSAGITSLPAGVVWDIRRDALPETVAYVTPWTPSLASTLKKRMTLTGACVVNVPTVGVQDGDFLEVEFIQGGGGTLDLSAFVDVSGYTPPTISATIGHVFLFAAKYSALAGKWRMVTALPYDE